MNKMTNQLDRAFFSMPLDDEDTSYVTTPPAYSVHKTKSKKKTTRKKRKKAKKPRYYYAVARGRKIGVYKTWNQCKRQIDGYCYPKFRKFKTEKEARSFIRKYWFDHN